MISRSNEQRSTANIWMIEYSSVCGGNYAQRNILMQIRMETFLSKWQIAHIIQVKAEVVLGFEEGKN